MSAAVVVIGALKDKNSHRQWNCHVFSPNIIRLQYVRVGSQPVEILY